MTVEYADFYIRKYITLIDSLTILMTVFNVVTKLCWFLNYLFTKSYMYCTIFEPILNNFNRSFYDSFESNINLRSNYFGSPNPSSNKLELIQNKKRNGDLSIIKLNNKSNLSLNRSIINNSSLAPAKSFEIQKNDEIKGILIDIQNHTINNKINFSDNFLFFFAKIFNLRNKKQLYLQRLEKVLQHELSIDYILQEFKRIELALIQDMRNNDLDSSYLGHTKSTKGQSLYSQSINNK